MQKEAEMRPGDKRKRMQKDAKGFLYPGTTCFEGQSHFLLFSTINQPQYPPPHFMLELFGGIYVTLSKTYHLLKTTLFSSVNACS